MRNSLLKVIMCLLLGGVLLVSAACTGQAYDSAGNPIANQQTYIQNVPLIWQGSLASAPASPALAWAYHDTTTGMTMYWQGSAWQVLATDGLTGLTGATGATGPAGSNGTNGLSIVWKGSLSSAPGSPVTNWAYYNTSTLIAYIYDGSTWQTLYSANFPTGRTASYVFATSDALASDKAQANQVLTGTADNVAVTAALTAGYKVITFLGVTSTFAGTVTLLANNTIIHANGVVFSNNASTPLFSDGGKTGCVFQDVITDAGGITFNVANTEIQNCTLGSYYIGLNIPNVLSNTIFGPAALYSNTTGAYNSAFGQAALYSNTTGAYNSAFGQAALQNNTTGNYNSAFGQAALYSNTTGAYNSAFGQNALLTNTTGNNNSAFGQVALAYNTTGNYNSAFGQAALLNNTTGNSNSAFGQTALQSNTTGGSNSAFGQAALYSNTTGSNNLGLGYFAGFYNTTASNQLFINTLDQGSYANDVKNSLIYGIFNSTPASQTLSLNAGTINMAYLPTSSGGAAGSLWIDTTAGYVIKVNH